MEGGKGLEDKCGEYIIKSEGRMGERRSISGGVVELRDRDKEEDDQGSTG